MSIRFVKSRAEKGHAPWEVEVPVRGKRERRYEETEEQAKQTEKEMLARLEINCFNINQAINQYSQLISVKKVSNKHEKRFFKLMSAYFESIKLIEVHEIKHRHLVGLQQWLQKNHKVTLFGGERIEFEAIGPATVNRYFSAYRDFFKYCKQNEYMLSNPCEELDPLEFDASKREPASPEAFKRYVESCPEYFKRPAWFLYFTGFRPITVSALTWEKVDFDGLAIHYTTRKGFKGKIKHKMFPMIPELKALLHEQAEFLKTVGILPIGKNRVFLNSELRPLTASRISKLGNAALKRAGLNDLVQYSMRYALARDLQDAGVELEKISKLMGHAATRMTEHYAGPAKMGAMGKVLSTVRNNLANPSDVAILPQKEVGAT